MQEEIILIAEDSPRQKSAIPPDARKPKTIVRIEYEVLSQNPYTFTVDEFFKKVNHDIRKKTNLNIQSYLLVRSLLPREWGWGIHVDSDGKLGLVPAESVEYRRFLNNPSVKQKKAYRKSK